MISLRVGITISLLTLIFQESLTLRNVNLIIPEAAERGSLVEMKCLYELEGEVLYSVKWYRGDREFCRYSPRDVPPLKIFPIPGIEVQRDATGPERLTIVAAKSTTAEGRYTCEVSADSPSFQTAQVHAFMYVVDLPKSGPELHGIKLRYKAGMKLKAECISRDSLPAANLSFYVNNEPAHKQHVTHRVDGQTPDGLMTAYSTIQFVVQNHHFVEGRLRIRCTAIIYSVYIKTHEKSSIEVRIPTTPSSKLKDHDAVVYSIHRQPETNAGQQRRPAATTTIKILAVITLLSTALR
ncbi:uncharacterized protein ACR2FA_006344 [Aphomia sociella]